MAAIEPLRGLRITDKEVHGLLNSWKNGVDNGDLGKDFHDLVEWGFTSYLLSEKFTRVPISRLVPLSLAYGSVLHDLSHNSKTLASRPSQV